MFLVNVIIVMRLWIQIFRIGCVCDISYLVPNIHIHKSPGIQLLLVTGIWQMVNVSSPSTEHARKEKMAKAKEKNGNNITIAANK